MFLKINDYPDHQVHLCINATGGNRCDICFGSITQEKDMTETTQEKDVSKRITLKEFSRALGRFYFGYELFEGKPLSEARFNDLIDQVSIACHFTAGEHFDPDAFKENCLAMAKLGQDIYRA